MQSNHYYTILQLSPEASLDEIKRAYHEQAKKNHPDLHPPENRHTQQLVMMKINEAYMGLMSTFQSSEFTEATPVQEKDNNSYTARINELGPLRDPAYTYYKLGFDLYNQGQVTFHKRFDIKAEGRTINLFLGRKGLLNQAISAIQKFERAYHYFMKVTEEYPNSMWADDASNKLADIEKLNTIYEKICIQITEIS